MNQVGRTIHKIWNSSVPSLRSSPMFNSDIIPQQFHFFNILQQYILNIGLLKLGRSTPVIFLFIFVVKDDKPVPSMNLFKSRLFFPCVYYFIYFSILYLFYLIYLCCCNFGYGYGCVFLFFFLLFKFGLLYIVSIFVLLLCCYFCLFPSFLLLLILRKKKKMITLSFVLMYLCASLCLFFMSSFFLKTNTALAHCTVFLLRGLDLLLISFTIYIYSSQPYMISFHADFSAVMD